MITLTDIFAGAGGSSQGAITVPGVEVRTAANHWQLAVDVHQQNHPDTEHACVDLHLEDPRRFPRTDILWASPECTKWSQASGKTDRLTAELGGDPSLFDGVPDALHTTDVDDSTRSRLLMFDVLRFVEHHRYRAVIVENVVDIATQAKYSAAWRLWQAGLRKLGYAYRVVSHNAMHAQAHGLPAPQSRDRLYIVAWPEGEKAPDIDAVMRPRAYCPRCDVVVESRQAWKPGRKVGKYRQQYVYACSRCGVTVQPGWLPAASAIDWSLRGERIGDKPIRKYVDKTTGEVTWGPLAPKTMTRIAAGIARYWTPLTIEAGGHTYDAADPHHIRHGDPNGYYRAWPVDDYLRTLHASESRALAVPVEGREGKRARPVDHALRTMTTRNETALAFMVSQRDGAERRVRQLDQPIWTLTATGNNVGIVQPFIAELRGGGSSARSTSDPAATFTASGNHHALIAPYYSGSDTAKPVTDPVGTISTRDHHALIMRHNSSRSGDGAEMVTPTAEYLRTLTTKGHQSIITPGDIEAAQAQVDDCEFRMLEPAEIAAGMAFPRDYQWAGSRRDRVKLAGNAVCPPAARDLVAAVVESLA